MFKEFVQKVMGGDMPETKYVLNLAEAVSYKKNDFILNDGDVENYVYFIKEGITRFWIQEDNKEITYFFSLSGDFATSYQSLRQRIPSSVNHQCITDVQLLRIKVDDFNQALKYYPQLSSVLIPVLDKLIFYMLEREKDLLSKSPEQLYKKLIAGNPEYIQQIPMKYLATYLGITAEALSRIRKRIN